MTRSIPIDDRGLTLGVGLFETVLFVDGTPRLWNAHIDRLHRSCTDLGLPRPPSARLERAAGRALRSAGLERGRAAVRMTWTGGSGVRGLSPPAHPVPRLLAQAMAATPAPLSISLATASVRRNPTSPTSRMKTLSYLDNVLAREEACASGADDALMLDREGHVACAAAANIFWFEGDRLCTPALDCGVLPGVVRARMLAAALDVGLAPDQLRAPRQRLLSGDGAFLTNSLIEAVAISHVDGTPLQAPPASKLLSLMARLR